MKQSNKVIPHTELAARCMNSADMMRVQTNNEFLKFWAEPEAIPLCYMLFAYHQNAMICDSLSEADVIVELYESDDGEPPHIMGTKDTVVYLALFKKDEGIMPWLVNADYDFSIRKIETLAEEDGSNPTVRCAIMLNNKPELWVGHTIAGVQGETYEQASSRIVQSVLNRFDTFPSIDTTNKHKEWLEQCEIFTVNTDEYGFHMVTINDDEQLQTVFKLVEDGCDFLDYIPNDLRIGDTIRLTGGF